MEKEDSKDFKWTERRRSIPYTRTRLILSFFGALPCFMDAPYIPSRDIKKSTFIYCIAFFGVQSLSTAVVISTMLGIMEDAYPYDYVDYIIAFQMIIYLIPNIVTVVSWLDVDKTSSVMQAWSECAKQFEAVLKSPLPRRLRKTEHTVNVIILTSAFMAIPCASLVSPPKFVSWKFAPSIVCSNIVQLVTAHHWIGYNMTMTAISDDITGYLKQLSKNNTLTAQLLEDVKLLWIMLRKLTDKMGEARVPLYFCFLQFFMSTIMLFESALFYFHTGEILISLLGVLFAMFYAIPFTYLCWTSHVTTVKLEHVFEDALSGLELSSLSYEAQRQMCMIYLVKRARKCKITLFAFETVDFSLFIRSISGVLTYVLILMQFHLMRTSAD